jgi:NCS1 family nucleobase:cation symporter-1
MGVESVVVGSTAAKSASDQAFEIETHGIDIIPDEERHGHPRDIFWVWAAACSAFGGLILGGIVGSLGLPLWASILAIVLANTPFIIVGYLGTAGPETGTSTIVIARAAFGTRGNWPGAFLSWMTVIGWDAVNAVIGTLALVVVLEKLGIGSGQFQQGLALIIFVTLTIVIAVFGHATIVLVQKPLTILIAVGLLATFVFALPNIKWDFAGGALAGATGLSTFFLAMAIPMAAGPFSFLNYPADYTRYLPRSASRTQTAAWTALGAFLPSALIEIAGVLLATGMDMSDPVNTLQNFIPGWFLLPFLAVVVLGLVSNNILNSYSSGLSLMAAGLRVKRHHSVLIDAVVMTIVAAWAIFFFNFIGFWTQFLSMMVIWLAPWGGVFAVDYWLRHTRYRPAELLKEQGGAYWYRSGVNWRAIAAFAIGALAAFFTTNAPLWVSPLVSGPLGGADLSSFAGFIVGGLVYYLLERHRAVDFA